MSGLYFYEITGDPTGDFVTVDEAKAYGRITTTAEDGLMQMFIDASVQYVEKTTNRVLRDTEFTGYFSELSKSANEYQQFITLEKSPCTSISSVALTEDNVNYSEIVHEVRKSSIYYRVFPQECNSKTYDEIYPYKVVFNAGYITAPIDLKMAVMKIALAMFNNRDCGCEEAGNEASAILNQYKIAML